MGAEAVIVSATYDHGVTDISDVDAIVFTDNAVPDVLFNARKTATVEWVKQCLASLVSRQIEFECNIGTLTSNPSAYRSWVCFSRQRFTVKGISSGKIRNQMKITDDVNVARGKLVHMGKDLVMFRFEHAHAQTTLYRVES